MEAEEEGGEEEKEKRLLLNFDLSFYDEYFLEKFMKKGTCGRECCCLLASVLFFASIPSPLQNRL